MKELRVVAENIENTDANKLSVSILVHFWLSELKVHTMEFTN